MYKSTSIDTYSPCQNVMDSYSSWYYTTNVPWNMSYSCPFMWFYQYSIYIISVGWFRYAPKLLFYDRPMMVSMVSEKNETKWFTLPENIRCSYLIKFLESFPQVKIKWYVYLIDHHVFVWPQNCLYTVPCYCWKNCHFNIIISIPSIFSCHFM